MTKKTSQKTFVGHLGTKALTSTHPEIKKLKRQGIEAEIHGNKVWRSSYVIMDYFEDYPVPAGQKVMDIGCGWGLTGIYLANRFDAKVLGIDADENVKPFLDAQARVNKTPIAFEKKTFQQIKKKDMTDYHTLVGADICFWEELVDPLFKLIKRAMNAGVKQVLIADPGRSPYWELVERCTDEFSGTAQVTRSISKPYRTTKEILIVKPG